MLEIIAEIEKWDNVFYIEWEENMVSQKLQQKHQQTNQE